MLSLKSLSEWFFRSRRFVGYIVSLSLVIVEACVNLNCRTGLIIAARGHLDCSCNRYKLDLFVLIRRL
jgi:hypothetical protein